jgi:hypothetical protein
MKIITEDINKNKQNILGILKHYREVTCCTKVSSCIVLIGYIPEQILVTLLMFLILNVRLSREYCTHVQYPGEKRL